MVRSGRLYAPARHAMLALPDVPVRSVRQPTEGRPGWEWLNIISVAAASGSSCCCVLVGHGRRRARTVSLGAVGGRSVGRSHARMGPRRHRHRRNFPEAMPSRQLSLSPAGARRRAPKPRRSPRDVAVDTVPIRGGRPRPRPVRVLVIGTALASAGWGRDVRRPDLAFYLSSRTIALAGPWLPEGATIP